MNQFTKLIPILALAFTMAFSRAPLESYKRYMIVMVHGVGANTNIPHDYQAPDPESDGTMRKSAIFDQSADDVRPVTTDPSNWMGDLGGDLKKQGFLGHVVWYDFYEPWLSPVYVDDAKHRESLSRYLGDRTITTNPMGLQQPIYSYTTPNGVSFSNPSKMKSYCYGDDYTLSLLPIPLPINPYDCVTNAKQSTLRTSFFGTTGQTFWLKNLFAQDYPAGIEVKYDNHTGSFLQLAQDDYRQWHKVRYGINSADILESTPKKYILIGHSMGGLTSRDYITGSFYKGDVDKLITLDSPHEGSAIANYVQYWHESANQMGQGWKYGLDYSMKLLGVGLSVYETAKICINDVAVEGAELWAINWIESISTMSLLYKPMVVQQISSEIALSTNDYHVNEWVTGKPHTGRGIDFMTLVRGEEELHTPNPLLSDFNARTSLQDKAKNSYQNPFFRLVYTDGVPTPGGPGYHESITKPYLNLFVVLPGTIPYAFMDGDEGAKLGPDYFIRVLHRLLTAVGVQSFWNEMGSGFVPKWSSKADRVAIFSQPNSDTKKVKLDYDFNKLNASVFLPVYGVIEGFLAYKLIEDNIPANPVPQCVRNIFGLLGAT